MQEYVTIYAPAEDEFVERKSRFIGAIAPVQTEEEAQAWIAQVRQQHRDATHNTYAYILRNGIKRYSDDGEPQGTAGVPMLDCIEKEGLVDVAVVVTRYFGGILLGAGGLTRAYGKAARDALSAAGVSTLHLWSRGQLHCDYSLLERIKLDIAALGGLVDGMDYGADVTSTVSLPQGACEVLQQRLTELSAGAITLESLGQGLRPGPREDI